MRRYYDDQLLRDIESRLDIVDIISETVNLNRKGNRYWGLCPFHQEKTPSFSVTPDKNMFYCFGCHTGGDIFSFVMKREGIEFKEAVELLASRAGIQLISSSNNKQSSERKKIIEVNQAAADFFNQVLLSNQAQTAREYLKKRGIDAPTIKTFQLGYALDSWTGLEEYLLRKGFLEKHVKLSGLIKRNENKNRFYDLFRKRIMFPIYHYNGEIIGFGGRVLDDGIPKYLNTPETEIFSKRKTLYGLFQARDIIRKNNEAILVEGYMDCIRLYQADIKNTVASLGTAFTREQAKLLGRYTEKVLILYDGDEAGQRETMRAINILTEEGLKVSVVTLPGGKDPDEYLDSSKKEEFLQFIKNNKISYIEFKINRYINNEKVLNLESKIRILNSLKGDITLLNSELEKDYYTKILAQKLQLEENLIYREFNPPKQKKKGIKRNKTEIVRDNIKYGNYSLEEKILAAMLNNKEVFKKVKQAIGLTFFARPEYKALAQLYEELVEPEDNNLQNLGRVASRKGLGASLAKIVLLIEEGIQLTDIELEEFINKVKLLKWKSHWRNIYRNLNMLKDKGDFDNLLKFILNLDTFLNNTQEGGGNETG